MPRQPRVTSGTEIYHVMMRGINHQNIFEEPEDFYQFINILDRMRTQYDDEGNSCGTNCIYYAYCLKSNYFHLLIRERMRKLVIPSRELQVHMSIVTQIKDYKYSSWCEYDGTVEPIFQICNTQTVVNRIHSMISESQAFPIAANSKSSTEEPSGRHSFSLRNLEHLFVSFNA